MQSSFRMLDPGSKLHHLSILILEDLDSFVAFCSTNKTIMEFCLSDTTLNFLKQQFPNLVNQIEERLSTPSLLEKLDLHSIQFLIRLGVDPNSILYYSVLENMIDPLIYLSVLHIPVNPNQVNLETSADEPLLTTSVRYENYPMVKLLLKLGADPNQMDLSEETPLHMAIRMNHLDLVKILLNYGADVNSKDSPLALAVIYSNNLELIKVLLEAGGDPNIVLSGGKTLLMEAIRKDKDPLVDLLLEYDADPNINDSRGYSPLLLAVKKKNLSLVEALLNHQADPNVKTPSGETPLLTAIYQQDVPMVSLLLRYGADPHQTGYAGTEPLLAAKALKNTAIYELLLRFIG